MNTQRDAQKDAQCGAAPPKPTTPWRETYRQLLRTAGNEAAGLRTSLLGLLAAAACQGLALACLLPLFSAVLTTHDGPQALHWLLAMLALMLLTTVLRWRAQGFDYDGRMAQATHELRLRLGEQLRRMPLERLQDKRAGEVNTLLLGSVDVNLNLTLIILNLILTALVTPLVAALAVMAYDWRLGLLMLALLPAIGALQRRHRPAHAQSKRALAAASERSSADIVEYLQGLPVLRAARCEGERAAALQAGFKNLEQIQTTAHRRSSRPSVVVASIMELGLLAIVIVGMVATLHSGLDIAVVAAVMVMVARFAEPLASVVTYTVFVEMIEAALERIEALLAITPLAQRQPTQRPKQFEVCFKQVEFQYLQGTQPALRDFSATLAPCSLTALVGPSGSGKSTLTRLLLRHADPQQGAVTIGGIDLRDIAPEELSALISVVFQDVYLFDDTVMANIRLGKPDATDAEVQIAARAAQCLDFIERLPQGWQTRLGDIGGRLSGGERQRISIARALLKDAPIVILDEPTSALDTESELAVQRAIDALVRDKTVIVIAHRLSTTIAADQILVIDDGQLVQHGRHGELLAQDGRYRNMWDAQSHLGISGIKNHHHYPDNRRL